MHIDAKVIEGIRSLDDGDPQGFLNEVIDAYLGDSVRKLETIRAGWEAKDARTLAASSHSLKGSSGNIGAFALAALCERFEKAARSGSLAGLEALYDELRAEFSRVEGELGTLRREGRRA